MWEPFEYKIEDFNGNFHSVRGFFPCDARKNSPCNVKKIHGPLVKGFWSWLMNQISS